MVHVFRAHTATARLTQAFKALVMLGSLLMYALLAYITVTSRWQLDYQLEDISLQLLTYTPFLIGCSSLAALALVFLVKEREQKRSYLAWGGLTCLSALGLWLLLSRG